MSVAHFSPIGAYLRGHSQCEHLLWSVSCWREPASGWLHRPGVVRGDKGEQTIVKAGYAATSDGSAPACPVAVNVSVIGPTDIVHSTHDNEQLVLRRATAIAQVLKNRGHQGSRPDSRVAWQSMLRRMTTSPWQSRSWSRMLAKMASVSGTFFVVWP